VKASIYDGWVCVGSANFDRLSLRLNRELNISSSEPEVAEQLLERVFETDFRSSPELTEPIPDRWIDHLVEIVGDYIYWSGGKLLLDYNPQGLGHKAPPRKANLYPVNVRCVGQPRKLAPRFCTPVNWKHQRCGSAENQWAKGSVSIESSVVSINPLNSAVILYWLARAHLFFSLLCRKKPHPLTQHDTCAKYRTL